MRSLLVEEPEDFDEERLDVAQEDLRVGRSSFSMLERWHIRTPDASDGATAPFSSCRRSWPSCGADERPGQPLFRQAF